VAALLDKRGGEIGTLDFANSPEGMCGCKPGSSSTPVRWSSVSRTRPLTAGSRLDGSRDRAN
jgi:hypothetical protein